MRLLQIVPGLPPRVDGIGDYAVRMAWHLRREHGIETHFLVAQPDWRSESPDGRVAGFAATALESRTADALLGAIAAIEQDDGKQPLHVLVQFSTYSYQKRGCPFWIVDGLERRHAQRPGTVHVAMHELEDTSKEPWRSPFWLAGTQRSLIRRVAGISNFRYTNSELSRGRLESWGVGRFDLILNFSTLEEPETCVPFAERERVVVVFGRGAQRSITYRRASHALAALCRNLEATRIVDIGEPLGEHTASAIGGVPIERCGRLPAGDVLARMGSAVASFIHYPVPMLTKSSVYAVSCSVGTMPYVYEHGAVERSCPGLVTGEDFIPVPHSLALQRPAHAAALSGQLFDRYQRRNSAVAAAAIANRLTPLLRGGTGENPTR